MTANKRVCETSAASSILDLPYEITHQIIDLCRPDGFEAVALTCKYLFAIAQPLIQSHEACKRQVWTLALERNRGNHNDIILRDPYAFLGWLITLPNNQQIDQLRYFRDIIYVEPPRSKRSDHPIDQVRDRYNQLIDRIRDRLRHSGDDTFLKSPRGQELIAFEIKEKIESGYPHLAALIESAKDTIPLRHASDGNSGPELLATFTELRSLVISSDFDLPKTIRQLNGFTHFQNLEELYIIKKHYGIDADQPGDILSLCMLPKLRVLMFSGSSEQSQLLRNARKPIDIQKSHPSRASLESLAVKGIENRYEDLDRFFAELPKIRSLLWEDDTHPYDGNDCSRDGFFLDANDFWAELEAFEDIPEPDRDLAIRAEYPELYNAIDIAERRVGEDAMFDTDCVAHITANLSRQEQECSPPLGSKRLTISSTVPTEVLFRPSVLLHRIIAAYAGQLEHLAIIAGFMGWRSADIQRKYKILHFRDLPRLKYLEFDTNVVRPRKGEEMLLPPLRNILPSHVEIVSVVIRYPYSQQLAFLCQGIVEAKLQGLMKLRRIIVKDTEQCERSTSDLHAFIERIKDTLEEVGIIIEWRPTVSDRRMNVTMDWENPKVIDDLDVKGLTYEYH